jgi:opacity protein-like surface antigen
MVYDRYSVSAGAFGYTSDGWRPNNDNRENIQDVYFQSAITPEVNAQVEFRRRDSDFGDLPFNFDPDSFSRNLRRNLDLNTYRAGLRYSPVPTSDFLVSLIYSDAEEDRKLRDDPSQFSQTKDQGIQSEAQYIYRTDRFNLTTGLGYSDVDRNFDEPTASNKQQITDANGYMYGNLNLPNSVIWTAGIGYTRFDQNAFDGALKVNKVNPKFGLQWNITKDLLLRGAMFRYVKPPLVNNQTLEPTEVAWFNQLYDDVNATASWRYGVGLDHRLMSNLFVGGEATWRELSVPIVRREGPAKVLENADEETHRAYVHWLPIPEVALSAEFVYDRFSIETRQFLTEGFGFPEKLVTYSVPFGVRYFHPSGFFAGVGATYVNQQVNRSDPSPEGSTDFFVVDAAVGYRLPKRFGIVSLSVANLSDNKFKYQDDSFREFQTGPSIGPYLPDRQILARVTLNW